VPSRATGGILTRLHAIPWWGWLGVPLAAWLVTRVLITGLAVIASIVLGRPEFALDPSVPESFSLLGSWDTTWYLDIAHRGYAFDVGQVGQVFTNVAFFPLLPMIMWAAISLGLNPFWVSLVVGNGMFLVALVSLFAITKARFGHVMAVRSTWVLALAPPAIAASMAYTEGIALGLAIGAAYLAWRQRFVWAGFVAAFAVLIRPTGVIVLVPVLMLAWAAGSEGRWRRLITAAIPTAVIGVSYLTVMQVRQGGWDLPLKAQAAWGRGQLGVGLLSLLPDKLGKAVGGVFGGEMLGSRDLLGKQTLSQLSGLTAGDWSAVVRDLLFGILYAVLLSALWRKEGGLKSPWVLYSFLMLIVPLSSGTVTSLARLGLMAWPLAWPMAEWLGRGTPSRRRWAIIAALVAIMLMVAQLSGQSP
jgi:hypothetical protein